MLQYHLRQLESKKVYNTITNKFAETQDCHILNFCGRVIKCNLGCYEPVTMT